MTEAERTTILTRYADCEITAEHAAELLGPDTSVSEVIVATATACGRLPNPRNAFTEGEYRRALALFGLGDRTGRR